MAGAGAPLWAARQGGGGGAGEAGAGRHGGAGAGGDQWSAVGPAAEPRPATARIDQPPLSWYWPGGANRGRGHWL